MNWLMVAEGRARLGQKPIARKLHLSSPTPTPPHPPTTRNSPNFPEWPTSPFLTIQSCKKHFSCIRVRIKQKFSDKVFLVCRYHDHGWCSIIVATYSQPHLINIADHWTNQPTNNPIFYYADTFPSMIDLKHLPPAGYLYTFRIKEESFGHVDLDWTYSIIGGKGRKYQFV